MRVHLTIGTAILAVVCAALPVAAQSASPGRRQAQSRTVNIFAGGSTYLGIGVAEVTSEKVKSLNLKEERGALVSSVTADSPAAKAGIRENDVILEFDGQSVQGTAQLQRMVRETPSGRAVRLLIVRGGSQQTITATVEERKATANETPGGPWPMPQMPDMSGLQRQLDGLRGGFLQSPMLGIEGESLSQQNQFAEFLGAKDGVLVKSVVKNSAAEKAGIKAGDVIVKIDGQAVSNTRDITSKLRDLRNSKQSFPVVVLRNKKETSLTVTIETPARGRAVRAGSLRILNHKTARSIQV